MTPPKINTILLAEDDSDDRLLAQDAMRECGLITDLRMVEDGVQLMDYLHRANKYSQPGAAPSPSLILLDLNMPRKDGREALREIRSDANLRKIPVVIFTTSTADTDIAKVYDLGANSFISKPVAFNGLIAVMRMLADYWLNMVVLPGKA